MSAIRRGLVATPFITISRMLTSHRSAQGVIYADQLQNAKNQERIHVNTTGPTYVNNFSEFDDLYVYHGSDFSGSVNLFGGLNNFPYIPNFVNFSNFRGKVYSLVIDMPDYYSIMKDKFDKAKEKEKSWNPEWDGIDWDNLKRMCETAETVMPNDLISYDKLAIGDSHAICMYRPHWQNLSVPFKTLHGALKEGLESFIQNKDVAYSNIEFYFGNIDVRHHLCRQDDPYKATEELVDEYLRQAIEISVKRNCKVSLYELLPIENESRSIPKTGWYKNTPFYGSWDERNKIRKHFKTYLKQQIEEANLYNVEVYEWVGGLINSSSELNFDCMEKPQSVHLSRKWYPHWQGYEWSHAPHIDYEPYPERESTTLESFFT